MTDLLDQDDDLNLEIEEPETALGILNGNIPLEFFQKTPCLIGFIYVRFEVDGTVRPCCGSPFSIGNTHEHNFNEIWHSSAYYVWRAKFLRIHKRRFHLKDPEFSFCQMCPHLTHNMTANELLLKKRDG